MSEEINECKYCGGRYHPRPVRSPSASTLQGHERYCPLNRAYWLPTERCLRLCKDNLYEQSLEIEHFFDTMEHEFEDGKMPAPAEWRAFEKEFIDGIMEDLLESAIRMVYECMRLISADGKDWSLEELKKMMNREPERD